MDLFVGKYLKKTFKVLEESVYGVTLEKQYKN